MAVDWVYLELGRPDWIGRLPAACAAGPHRTLQSFVTVFCTEPDTKIQTPMQSKTIVAGGCLGGFFYTFLSRPNPMLGGQRGKKKIKFILVHRYPKI